MKQLIMNVTGLLLDQFGTDVFDSGHEYCAYLVTVLTKEEKWNFFFEYFC